MVRRLKASGLSEDQAEALTEALRDGHEADLASLATKVDLRETEVALKTDLRETEGRLDAKIADLSHRLALGLAEDRADLKLLEQRMTVKLGALVAAGVGILIAAFRYLPPAGH